MHSKFARVIIDRAIRRELDYAIPELWDERLSVGARVRVPFRDRKALATVVALLEKTNAKGIREIEAIMFHPEFIHLSVAASNSRTPKGHAKPLRNRLTTHSFLS